MKQTKYGKVLTVSLSVGAGNAIRENSKLINDEILELAEKLAIERSEINSYEPCILREDIEKLVGV